MRIFVLCYHRILPGGHITPETFAWQLRELKKSFRCVTLPELYAALIPPRPQGRDTFAITFDDGWRDNYVYAWPILKELGLRATLFLSTSLVRSKMVDGGSDHSPSFRNSLSLAAREVLQQGHSPEFLSWTEIEEMYASGVFEIQSHGHSHWRHFCEPAVYRLHSSQPVSDLEDWCPALWDGTIPSGAPVFRHSGALSRKRYFPDPPFMETCQRPYSHQGPTEKNLANLAARLAAYPGQWESQGDFLERVRDDLLESRGLIERHIGQAPTFLAWPFGEYSPPGLVAAQQAGFQACFTTRLGMIRPGTDPLAMPRFSPPASKKWFKIAISSFLGMSLYQIGVRAQAWHKGRKRGSRHPLARSTFEIRQP